MAPSEVVGVEIPQNLLEFIENKLKQKLTEQNLDAHHMSRMMRAMDGRWNAVIQSMVDLGKFRFEDEEDPSNSTYGKFYKGPKPIEEQISLLARMLELDPSHALAYIQHLPPLPEGAEGWFAVPAVPAGQVCEKIIDQAVCRKVFEKLGEVTLVGWDLSLKGSAVSEVKHSREIIAVYRLLEKVQKGDIWIIPAQLGMRHRGRSSRCAQEKYIIGEFGLTSHMYASILLMHPELLRQTYDLLPICSGDYSENEWDGSNGEDTLYHESCCVPCFEIRVYPIDNDLLEEYDNAFQWDVDYDSGVAVSCAKKHRGSATGFLV